MTTQEEQDAYVDTCLDKVSELADAQGLTTLDLLYLMRDRFDAWIKLRIPDDML